MTTTTNFTRQDGITLRDYMEARLSAIEKASQLAAQADITAKALTRQEGEDMRRRLDATATCTELESLEQRLTATNNLIDRQVKSLSDDIRSLSEFRAEVRGKASQQSVMIALGVSGLGVVLSIVSLVEKLGG